MRTVRRADANASDWGTRAFLATSALSVARELWRHGEPELAKRALALPPDDLVELGVRCMQLAESGDDDRVWPGGPKDKAFVLAAIEWIEGAARPARRRNRLPVRLLPVELQATERGRFEAAVPVADAIDARIRLLGSSDIDER
jgi:hypothetical protein